VDGAALVDGQVGQDQADNLVYQVGLGGADNLASAGGVVSPVRAVHLDSLD
jgi:hypothetical protein